MRLPGEVMDGRVSKHELLQKVVDSYMINKKGQRSWHNYFKGRK